MLINGVLFCSQTRVVGLIQKNVLTIHHICAVVSQKPVATKAEYIESAVSGAVAETPTARLLYGQNRIAGHWTLLPCCPSLQCPPLSVEFVSRNNEECNRRQQVFVLIWLLPEDNPSERGNSFLRPKSSSRRQFRCRLVSSFKRPLLTLGMTRVNSYLLPRREGQNDFPQINSNSGDLSRAFP